MDSSFISSSNRVTLNISTPTGEMKFNKGDLLRGLVQGVRADGLIMLMLKGRNLEAMSEVMIKQGQELFLRVEGFKDGKVYLKVLSPQAMNQVENSNIAAQLREQGIKPGEQEIQMAKKLIQHQLPVNNRNIQELVRVSQDMGEVNPRNLEIGAQLLTRGIEPNATTIKAFTHLFEGAPRLNQEVNAIIKVLQNILLQNIGGSRSTSTENTLRVAPPTQQVNQILSGQVNIQNNLVINTAHTTQVQPSNAQVPSVQIPIPSSESKAISNMLLPISEQRTAKFQELSEVRIQPQPRADTNISGQGINLGAKPSQSISLPTNEAQIQTRNQAPISNNILLSQLQNILTRNTSLPQNIRDLGRIVIELSEKLQLKLGEATSSTSNKIIDIVQSERDILRSLALLKNILNKMDIAGNNQLSDLSNRIDNMEKELGGQRLFNHSSSRSDLTNNFFIFSFPVIMDGQSTLCELRINKDSKQRNLANIDKLSFMVSLETPQLGIVIFHLEWHKIGKIITQGVVENENVCKYLNKNFNLLEKELEKLGYKVEFKGIKVASNEKELSIKPKLIENKSQNRSISIDITV